MNKRVTVGLLVVVAANAFAAGYFLHSQLYTGTTAANLPEVSPEGAKLKADLPEVVKLKADLQAARADRDDFAKGTDAKLWLDVDTAEAVKRLGYDFVYVVRWKNGIPDGWVEFDEGDGQKRIPLEGKNMFEASAKVGQNPVAKGSHGSLVVALRQIGKSDEFACEMSYNVTVRHEGGRTFVLKDQTGRVGGGQTFVSNLRKGKVKLESRNLEQTCLEFEARVNRNVNTKAIPWIEVKLVDRAK
jgi:hypothetical protein